jgi:hypothetical protein
MTYDLSGSIKVIMDTQTFNSGFTKREFVVTTKDQYPQDIKLAFVKEKTALLDKFKPGQDVTVSFDIRGNEYKGKYYVDLSAWRIQGGSSEGQAAPADEDGPPLDTDLPDSASGEDYPF